MSPVLLVDDDVTITAALAGLLEVADIPAVVASDAESAEAMVAGRFFPIVLADLRMRTDDDGLRLVETVRRLSPGSKVAMMTGYATPEIERRVLDVGAITLLRKPFDCDAFVELIRDLRGDNIETIFSQTRPRLQSMMMRRFGLPAHECEDVLQEAWCVLLERRRIVRDVGAFLAGTVMNLSRQALQLATRESAVDALPEVASCDADCSIAVAVRSALARVDERSRQLCELIALEELSYAEVSERLDLPIGSIGPLYMRAKKRLKEQLAN